MAYRVKYRIDQKNYRLDLAIRCLGTHKKNRGTVYPSGLRCKTLTVEVLKSGFLKEEVNHACIAVEEPPPEAFPKGGESASSYNIRKCSLSDTLCTCYQPPYDKVSHSLLSHNHIMLILRAFLTEARWNLEEIEGVMIFCDAEGKLSISAVAAYPNGKELAEMVVEGIRCEVLSYKMDLEEEKAATLISEALNHPNTLAMRQSELTAVAILKGEIMVQLSRDIAQQVAYASVLEEKRRELSTAADDPDLPEVFDWLIKAGVGTNTYVDCFLAWTAIFVDSSKRRLRLGAWAVLNRMPDMANWVKIAILERAYRKKPTAGYCPSPEAVWGHFSWKALEPLEQMLRYFHVGCKAHTGLMKPQSRIQLLANMDIAVAEAFLAAKDSTFNPQSTNEAHIAKWVQKVRKLLIEAADKYHIMLPVPLAFKGGEQAIAAEKFVKDADARASWIIWPQGAEQSVKDTAVAAPVAPRVIRFDEATGAQLNEQLSSSQKKKIRKKVSSWRCHGESGKKISASPWAASKPSTHPQSRCYSAFTLCTL